MERGEKENAYFNLFSEEIVISQVLAIIAVLVIYSHESFFELSYNVYW